MGEKFHRDVEKLTPLLLLRIILKPYRKLSVNILLVLYPVPKAYGLFLKAYSRYFSSFPLILKPASALCCSPVCFLLTIVCAHSRHSLFIALTLCFIFMTFSDQSTFFHRPLFHPRDSFRILFFSFLGASVAIETPDNYTYSDFC